MYDFIRIQYALGKISPEQLLAFVPKWITKEQAADLLYSDMPDGGEGDVH